MASGRCAEQAQHSWKTREWRVRLSVACRRARSRDWRAACPAAHHAASRCPRRRRDVVRASWSPVFECRCGSIVDDRRSSAGEVAVGARARTAGLRVRLDQASAPAEPGVPMPGEMRRLLELGGGTTRRRAHDERAACRHDTQQRAAAPRERRVRRAKSPPAPPGWNTRKSFASLLSQSKLQTWLTNYQQHTCPTARSAS